MLNDLDDAMAAGKGKAVVGGIVDGLIGYAKSHFAIEERYFELFAYPDAAAHKKEHAFFIRKVAEFFEQGDEGKQSELMTFLSDWCTQHVQGTDKKYAPLFNSKGLK